MEIKTLIKNILISNNQVAIPKVGSFVAKYKSAKINKHEITPPTKEIFFDQKLKDDDGVIVEYLMGQGLSKADAEKELAAFSGAVKKQLDTNNKVNFEALGYLSKNNKKIIFTPTTETSLLAENIGLGAVKVKKETNKGKAQAATATVPKDKTPKKTEQKSKKKSKALFFIIPIAIILILLGVFYKPILSKINQADESTQPTETIAKAAEVTPAQPEETTVKPVDDEVNAQLGNDEEYKKILNEKISSTAEVPIGNEYKKFYIIMGSFSREANALKLQKELKSEGNQKVIIIKGKDYYRVALDGYDKADPLIADYKKVTKRYENDIWILINK